MRPEDLSCQSGHVRRTDTAHFVVVVVVAHVNLIYLADGLTCSSSLCFFLFHSWNDKNAREKTLWCVFDLETRLWAGLLIYLSRIR